MTVRSSSSTRPAASGFAGAPLWFGFIFFLVGGGFMAVGWSLAIIQHYRLATYIAAPARVISSQVKIHHGSKGSVSYSPFITYTYTAGGHDYTATRAFPVGNISASHSWAQRIVDDYPAGTRTTAYYSPHKPSSSFLMRQGDWFPHIFALFPTIFMAIGIAMMAGARAGRARPPIPVANGGYRLHECGTLRGKLRLYSFMTLFWFAYCGMIIGDYFLINSRRVDAFILVAAAVCAALGLIPLSLAWRWWKLDHDFLDAEITINRDCLRPGEPCDLHVSQYVLRPLQIEEFKIGIICQRTDRTQSGGKTQYVTREHWSNWQTIESSRAHGMGSQITGRAHIDLPTTASATGSSPGSSYPKFSWHIAVRVAAQGQPVLNAQFPILMEPVAAPQLSAQV
jgi:hypothetical protein